MRSHPDLTPCLAASSETRPCMLAETAMNLLIGVLITFVVVILVLYLVNLLPIDGRAKQIVRVVVIIIGVLSLLRYVAVF
jgi:hypothetical protein